MISARTISIRLNISANYVGQGWAALMGLIFLPVYIQYLGMAAFGLIGFHATLHAWLSFAGNILGPVVNREVARFSADEIDTQIFWNKLRSLEWIGIFCSIGISLFLLLASKPIAEYWLQTGTIP